MNISRRFYFGLLLVLLLAGVPRPACAEAFWDFYYGVTDIEDDDVSASYQLQTILGPGPRSQISRAVSYDSSNIFGIRGGIWFESYPYLGVALDASYFEADSDQGVNIKLVPFSALLLLRYPMAVNDVFPNGRLQPYLGVGLTYAFADVSVDFQPDYPVEIDTLGSGFGPDFHAGMHWMFTSRFGVFVEFRYLNLNMDIDDSDGTFFAISGSQELQDVNADVAAQAFLGGLTFRY